MPEVNDEKTTERLRQLLDERGVEYETYHDAALTEVDAVFWQDRNGQPCSAIGNADDIPEGMLSVQCIISPEQTIAATLVSPVNNFTIDEIEDLYKDLCDSDGGTLMAIVDGVCYETDWGYGEDAVRHFIDMLRRRHRIEVDA